jgi:hypothetical protein
MLAILIFQFNHQCAVQSSMIPEEATSYFNGGSRGNFINAVSTRGGSDKESEGSRTSFAKFLFDSRRHECMLLFKNRIGR